MRKFLSLALAFFACAVNPALAQTSGVILQDARHNPVGTGSNPIVVSGSGAADRYNRVAPALGGYAADWSNTVSATATLLSGSPQYVTVAQLTQFNAQVGCLALFDSPSGTTPTLGTTVPTEEVCTNTAGPPVSLQLPQGEGINFNRGLWIACVGAAGASNATPGSTACKYTIVSSMPQSRYQMVSNPLVFANTPMINAWGCQGTVTAAACITATKINPSAAPRSALGAPIAPLSLPVLWSVGPTANPGTAGTGGGFADMVSDCSSLVDCGKHSLYLTSPNPVGGNCTNCWLYNATSAVNPCSVDGLGQLVMSSLYDPINSRWATCEVNSQPSYKWQTDGYTTPVSGFYYEVQFNAPALPAGFIPWSCQWIKNAQSYDAALGTNWANNHNSVEVDNLETGLSGTLVTPGTHDSVHPQQTLHEFGSQTTVIGQLAGLSVQRYTQNPGGAFTANIYDGNDHYAGLLVTANWYVFYLDGNETYRVAKTGMEEDTVGYTVKFSGEKNYDTPTASTSTTSSMTIKRMVVYLCTPAVGCPVG